MNEPVVYSMLAQLLNYPTGDFGRQLSACGVALHRAFQDDPAALAELQKRFEPFERAMTGMKAEDVQELYTRTFDISPVASLEVGWHLYGEAYERGNFLVKMREVLRASGISETTELPDHLSYLLLVLPHLEEGSVAKFIQIYLEPAVRKMLAGFEDQANPYRHLLETIEAFLQHHHVSMTGA